MKLQEKLIGATTINTAFVFDFDATMLHKYVGDYEVPSIISILRSNGYLGELYSTKSQLIKIPTSLLKSIRIKHSQKN